MAAHSSILAWRIPWTEEPGGLQPTGSQRVGRDRVTNTSSQFKRKQMGSVLKSMPVWVFRLPVVENR